MSKKCCKSTPPCKSCPKLKKRKKGAHCACLEIDVTAHPLLWRGKAG